MKIIHKIGLSAYLVFGGNCLLAQDVEQGQSIDNYAVEYLHIAEKQAVLYSGNKQDWHPRALNHPYLNETQYVKARLSYRKIIYPGELLRLDLSRDELVILSPNYYNIVLSPENVDYAELDGQTIIYFRRDSLPGSPSTGYYALLHSDKCKVLKKQTAALKTVASYSFDLEYVQSTNFYLYKDGAYYPIRTKSGFLKVLQPYKKELKRFISANKLSFRNNTGEFLIRTVREYEKLSGSP